MNVAALGVSPDSVAAQKKFSEKLSLRFPLLSDSDHGVAELYGVWQEKKRYGKTGWGIVRSSFLIGEDGALLGAWYNVKPEETVPRAMEALAGA